jgi:carbonic anhydrase
MKTIDKLLLENKAWAQEKVSDDPDFFKRLSSIQTPEFLWIGCSDSRVPANEITGTQPGEIFVHRNVANMVVHTDLNLLTVLEYAVRFLEVKHIIVCGHYGCGGIKAAASKQDFGIINKWLRNIKEVYHFHRKELEEISDEDKKIDRLVELNVMAQVSNLAKTAIIQKFWSEKKYPTIHGWVYGLNNGLIKPILQMDYNSKIDEIFKYD